ncbi:hypothetical protein CWE13_10380 [Aliidiomarina shirensis]|uniref:Uncharacterized protein n=1 Tax=Aliidiomarina shirensis TaxID=1048642 RepID=A0A432WQJ2_9GAMM|nr:DUF6367 family protein [Aliidiomarina shirensis]RUO35947.1 hypothetical protein CWE13_10380 [Aliidiomarina shirensis]
MVTFLDFLELENVDKVVVLISEATVPDNAILNEGRWVESGKKDWMIRVDAEDPAIPLQRHVHIARSKHMSAKNMQASWNEDQTRHDRGSFNDSVGSRKVVQDLARDALNLPSDAILEHVETERRMLLESTEPTDELSIVYFRLH